jgi:hypothetical protein
MRFLQQFVNLIGNRLFQFEAIMLQCSNLGGSGGMAIEKCRYGMGTTGAVRQGKRSRSTAGAPAEN